MSSPSDAARTIDEFSRAVSEAPPDEVGAAVTDHYHEDATWQGPAPIDAVDGATAAVEAFWEPLARAFPDFQRDDYALFGGRFEGDQWVCATGNLVGTFEREFLDVPATGHATWLRYGELHRLEGGAVAETTLFVDLLDLLRQAGYEVVPAAAPQVVAPGPTTHDGVILDERDTEASARTLDLVERMIFEGLGSYAEVGIDGMGLDDYWHEDFMWYGPAGIGSTRGIDGFQAYHQAPFLEAFPDRESDADDVRFARGTYCAWGGYPSIDATHAGDGWLGLPATGTDVEMRVMDVWRREGDRLAENWVFIDMIDLLDQIGVDAFERVREDRQYV